MENKQYIHIGTFGKPIGLKGYIKINIHLNSIDFFKSLDSFLDEDGKDIWVFESLKEQGKKIIGKLSECDNRDCALALMGRKIFICKKKFPKIKDNQFYIFDLIGSEVLTQNENLIGEIINIDNFGAGDLINIKNKQGKTIYIPMNEENVVKVDIKKRFVIVNPVKGILD